MAINARESDTWPTDTMTANRINGELLWPSVVGPGDEIGFGDKAQLLLDAPPQCQNPGGNYDIHGNPAKFEGSSGYSYEVTPFLGLRGTFWSSSRTQTIFIVKEENYSAYALRVYRLWQRVGVSGTALGDEQAQDVAVRNYSGGRPRFGSHLADVGANMSEARLVGKLNLYYYDGSSVDGDGRPIMRRYYIPGQAGGASSSNVVGQGFYEIHSDRPPTPHEQREVVAAAIKSRQGYDTTGISGGQGSGGLSGSGVGSREARGRATGGHGPQGFEGFGGDTAVHDAAKAASLELGLSSNAADTAAAEITATHLAWATLQREMRDHSMTANGFGGITGGPLLSGYARSDIRTNLLSAAAGYMRDMPAFGGSPDTVQSRINGNLQKKLHDEGFADHWIKFFLSVENINTITVAGFMTRDLDEDPKTSGFDSGLGTTGILAGLNPALTPGGNHLSPFEPEPETPPSIKIVVRAPFGYISPPGVGSDGGGAGDSFTKPQLVQWFPRDFKYSSWTLRTLNTSKPHSERFIFDYAPNEIQYQGLGAEWVEVPRTGDLPLVEFSKWSLMRVTMQFLIANTNVDSLGMPHPDGLVTGVYDKIEKLRAMAQRPFPVSVMNVDQLLRVSMKRAEIAGRPLEFVISDFSITSQQRTIIKGSNEITAAQCSLTLQEIPIEAAFKMKFRRPIVSPAVIATDAETLEKDLSGIVEVALETSKAGTGFSADEIKLNPSGAVGITVDMLTHGGG